MDIKESKFNERNASALPTNLTNPPQLTPTGKISHAKTRVYTQRYRKAWEHMPDFKGWLTSVPDQPTRAFCTYCRKNLHAHRLSLLKHTCTMKHQRGALMHQKETNALASVNASAKAAATNKEKISQSEEAEAEDEPDELDENSEEFRMDNEEVEDEEEIEYVVERLDDDDDDIIDDDQSKEIEGDTEYVDEEEDDNLPITKKIKIESSTDDRSDALAEAMAHVHGEYLDESGDSVNVEDLEMVVESVDPTGHGIRIVSVHSEADNEMPEERLDNDENSCTDYAHDQDKENDQDHETISHERAGTISSYKSSLVGESSDGISEADDTEMQMELVHQTPLSMPVRRDYLTKPSTARSISGIANTTGENNGATILSGKKTITLTSGGKTMTIDSSDVASYTGGSRYVFNVTKEQATDNNLPNEKRRETSRTEGQIKIAQQQHQQITATPVTVSYSPVAGGSQSAPKKHIILKSVKPLIQTKKPCISTHVLDTSKGHPVGGLQISLYKLMDGRWTFLNESTTTADGRCADLIDTSTYTFTAGRYKLHFDVDKYFILRRIETIYPFIEIVFDVKNPTEHYHVPLLLSPFGYTTYRGS